MLKLIFRKIINQKWMVLSLLIGSILMAAFAGTVPIYTETALRRSLDGVISDYVAENNVYPLQYQVKTMTTVTKSEQLKKCTADLQNSGEKLGVELLSFSAVYTLSGIETETNLERDDRVKVPQIGAMSDLEDHIELIEGTGYEKEPGDDGVLDVIITESAMKKLKLLLGEELTFKNTYFPDGSPFRVRISGVFRSSSETDTYWAQPASSYSSVIFMDQDLFEETFLTENLSKTTAKWYACYSTDSLTISGLKSLLQKTEEMNDTYQSKDGLSGSSCYEELFTEFLKTEKKVRTTFLVLEIPIFALLIVFIFMVTRQLLDMEKGEIAVMQSRGAGRGQIIFMYFLESLLIEAAALAVGIPLSLLLCRLLGSTSAFLQFVHRKNLQVEMNGQALLQMGAAALVSILAMVIPSFVYAKTTIVEQKQKKHKRKDTPFFHKYFLDLVVLGISLYGLFSFSNQKEYLAERVLEGQSMDPLLFLSSSIFMLGAGLVLLRILWLVSKLLFRVFQKHLNPVLYVSLIQINRTRKSQSFIMIFLMMTIALGVFNASAARTIYNNDERNIRYNAGADIVLKEAWSDNSAAVELGTADKLEYKEPDYGRYMNLEGAESYTRVYNETDGKINVPSGVLEGVQVMGIVTNEFGETAWMEDGLLTPHWYTYLNALAKRSDAVLVSSNLKDYGYKIGDTIVYQAKDQTPLRAIIYGFVDYWPGYSSTEYVKDSDGLVKETEHFLVVGSLYEQQEAWGVLPYEVWIRNTDGSTYIQDFITENKITLKKYVNTESLLAENRQDAVQQGTYGILTLGFVTSLVICTVGFLIYWILSIRQRELQFGIFRAMGMSMKEIVLMLLNEHFFISVLSIAGGAGIGILTSKLFMSLIQIAYSSADYVLPLKVVSDGGDFARLGVMVGIMLAICLAVIGTIIRKMRIAQALKLGED